MWLRDLARTLLRDMGRADDLVQDTVMAALRTVPGDVRSKRDWLGSVARRLARRQQRDEIRRRDHESLALTRGDAPSSETLVAAAEAAERVAAIARGLAEPLRRTVLERFLEGLSVQEIAERSGVKQDTVRWRLRRGLAQMRSELASSTSDDSATQDHWALALVPLAALPGPQAALVSAGATAALPTAIMSIKTLTLATALLLVAGLLWVQRSGTGPLPETDVIEPEAAPLVEIAAASPPGPERIALEPEQSTGPADTVDEEPSKARVAFEGRVVDERGRGVEGATVYLVDPLDSDLGRTSELPRTVTDRRGQFAMTEIARWLKEHPQEIWLRAVANGYLRSDGIPIVRGEEMADLKIVLRRGLTIQGRVLDEDGLPVEDLPLLAHSPFAGDDSISISRVAASAALRHLSPAEGWPHQQCESVTGRGGSVTFEGLDSGDYIVRSLDPGWELLPPREARGGGTGQEWTAVRRYSVRLVSAVRGQKRRALDKIPFLDRPMLRATFRIKLRLQDGTAVDTGQWFGRGLGEISFALTPDLVPDVARADILSVQFYGTARLDGEEVEWRSKVVDEETMRSGDVEEVTVKFRGKASRGRSSVESGQTEAPKPKNVPIELDVRYRGSGAPFSGPLFVDWTARTSTGSTLSGDTRGKRLSNGRYRVYVPAGKVDLTLKDANASGSLPSWAGQRTVKKSGSRVIFAELTEGAAVDLQRPTGWRQEWFVRASYRENPDEPWFGSWNYSSPTETLRLSSLKPAEWRFEVRQSPSAAPQETRIVTLLPGDDLTVD